jgi:DNA-binding LacI/PurR family transcriptional regulator
LKNRFSSCAKPLHFILFDQVRTLTEFETPMSIIDSMNRPTITDVARKCGLSKTTVSVILNESPASLRVPPETRERVKVAATELGYRASWRARALTSRRTHMIGVLYTPPMPIVIRGNYEGIMVGINEALHARKYHMLLVPLGDDPAEWGHVLLDQRMDGCLVLSRLRDPLPALLKQGRLPAALVNADTELPLPIVIADEYDASRQLMKHLLDLGHKRITFFLGEHPTHFSITERKRGYSDAMTAAGLERHISIIDSSEAELVARLKAEADSGPTALMVYTHRMAVKLLQLLWEAGIQVPKDLSVGTFSNAYPVEDVIPPLTTMALPTEEMGLAAAEMVLEQIDTGGQAPARRLVLKETLVVRRSTAAPRA